MKELERTKRISISAVLFVLILLIGFLTFKRPKYVFDKSAENTIEKIVSKDYLLSYNELKNYKPDDYVLIDIRDYYDYNNGHIENAYNISSHNLFDDNIHKFMRSIKNTKKQIILYGKDPDNALTFWMLLYQLGYENVKLLAVSTRLVDNKLVVTDNPIEKPYTDYAEAFKKATAGTPKKVEKTKPKKVITVPKKKKRVPEGGC